MPADFGTIFTYPFTINRKKQEEPMSDYHEPTGELSEKTRDYTRALHTLREEIEAVDWYRPAYRCQQGQKPG